MIDLTDEMAKLVDNALQDGVPCMMGTASKDGMPNISFRGSVMVFDKQHLAYWERAHNIAIHNLEENPKIEILYRGRERGVGWRFYGTAEIFRTGQVREAIMNRTVQHELDRDPDRKGFGVLITVEQVTDTGGRPLQGG
jgi:predicted pyridoxine 5'-phosphate oxidase superfamily flavin-nucleotide-binding protein